MFLQEHIARSHWVFLLVCISSFISASYGNCGEPLRLDFAALDNQFINQNNFAVGDTVTYSCVPGYQRVPGTKNTIVCLSDSTWSTPEMFCQKRSCGSPGEISNGEMELNSTLFGSRVYYKCNIGYRMISRRNYRECQSDGTWSNEVPECAVQICSPPDPTTDGSFQPDQDEYTYQDVVTYQCSNQKFALIGKSSLSCTTYGNWSSAAPKCVAVECQDPTVANSVKLSGFAGPYYYNFAVTFECSSGFTMIGSSSVKCNASSLWDPPLPICLQSCMPPDPIADGSFVPQKNQYTYQESVKYQCSDKTFVLLGKSSVFCTSYGNWSSVAPKCVVQSCKPPDPIADGSFVPQKNEYTYQESVKYQCSDKTFVLLGQSSVFCTSYGNWSSDAPKCVENNVAAVVGSYILLLTIILLGQLLSRV